jgi:type II secretory pathway pseudopilin PulG
MRRPSTGEEGFTIVEVIVAVLVIVVGALATFGLLSSAVKNTARAKATQVALEQAEQEVEALHGYKSEELAMTATPPHSNDPMNPDYRVSGSTFALGREATSAKATMVVNGDPIWGEPERTIEGGKINPGPIPFTSGDVSGEVYRYVVWRNDERCSEENCPGPQDYKQIIVAVKLDKPGNQAAERGYVEVQSDFVNPEDSAENDPIPNEEGGVTTAQQFFLTDTPCSPEANGTTIRTARQEITGDHLLHNTLGTCASGLQSSTTLGAPDALLLGRPPDPAPEDPNNPPLYDYSNDYYLDTNPDTTKGVQIVREEETGCRYAPKEAWNHPETQVHRWVTDPMGSDFKMTERATLEFYTRTLNDDPSTGTLCVYLFDRHEEPVEGELRAYDTPLTDKNSGKAYWEFTPDNEWPRYKWEKERLTMAFAPHTIHEGDRLGLALSVELANTSPAEAIPIMYDHPDHASRIEVDTTTPIEGG